ncbi:chemotaxis protein MotB [candidate division LCP-89 bacterium B3_LCP]|uniref:Chemotaxis protein MotB n=1 Tax=candidate division LCP-89 bacterium B3_LCP TaxID=2012998 RepID=A0A532V189_UNCL8|nr:MAG: chemotaxis protein MotB [candidate division LCP-89 bacterium B3_LCP]
MPKKKKKGGEEGGDERWLITYADLITLLLGLFVVLWSMGRADLEKYKEMRAAFKDVFGGGAAVQLQKLPGLPEVGRGGDGPYDNLDGGAYPDTSEAYLTAKLSEALEDMSEVAGEISVEIEERGVIIHLTESVLFDLGKAGLKPAAKKLLSGVAPVFIKSGRPIIIEGHTDNLPISTRDFPSNWQLSAARSANVVHYLTHQTAIPGDQISIAAFADKHPVESNETKEGRQKNRRVDVVFGKGNWKTASGGSMPEG